MTRVRLLNQTLDAISLKEAVDQILYWATYIKEYPRYVATVNLDYFLRAGRFSYFARVLKSADLTTADGMPLLWLSHLAGKPIKKRVAGSDLLPAIAEAAAYQKRSLYLLGGQVQTTSLAAEKLKKAYPGLEICGMASPQIFLKENTLDTNRSCNKKIVADINKVKPDILIMALGSPKTEIWLSYNRPFLKSGVAIGVGAAIDFVAGTIPRAPLWMQQSGFEWLFRLSQEPRRLTKRYVQNVLGLIGLTAQVAWKRYYKEEICS